MRSLQINSACSERDMPTARFPKLLCMCKCFYNFSAMHIAEQPLFDHLSPKFIFESASKQLTKPTRSSQTALMSSYLV